MLALRSRASSALLAGSGSLVGGGRVAGREADWGRVGAGREEKNLRYIRFMLVGEEVGTFFLVHVHASLPAQTNKKQVLKIAKRGCVVRPTSHLKNDLQLQSPD
jgi:hypothetical protein